jgi:hypothetical protein
MHQQCIDEVMLWVNSTAVLVVAWLNSSLGRCVAEQSPDEVGGRCATHCVYIVGCGPGRVCVLLLPPLPAGFP